MRFVWHVVRFLALVVAIVAFVGGIFFLGSLPEVDRALDAFTQLAVVQVVLWALLVVCVVFILFILWTITSRDDS